MPGRRNGPPAPSPFSSDYDPATFEEPAPRALALPGWVPSERGAILLFTLFVAMIISIGGSPGLHPGRLPTPTADPAQALAAPTAIPTATPPPLATAQPQGPTPTPLSQVQVSVPTAAVPVDNDPRAILPRYRILSYYGHPASERMGILGEFEMEEVLRLLLDEAEAYQAADPTRPIMPAFELIASVAQDWPAENNTYLLYTSDETIQAYVDFTAANGVLLILDVQVGLSTVEDEIDRVEKWLMYPHVHLAIDPEFSMQPGVVPGTAIGGVDAADITYAQNRLAKLTADNNLPPKVLIVHQFYEPMIRDDNQLAPVAGVQLLIEFDGFGAPANKIAGYNQFVRDRPIEFGGIKLFYRQDSPLMTPQEIVGLSPSPDLIIYQ
jgi:hypothetical protein